MTIIEQIRISQELKELVKKHLKSLTVTPADVVAIFTLLIAYMTEAISKAMAITGGKPEESGATEIASDVVANYGGEKPKDIGPIYNPKKADATIAQITEQVPVPKQTVITKKSDGSVKRQDPPKPEAVVEGDGFGTKKRKNRFFPGMGTMPLLVYLYLIDQRKVSLAEFTKSILPLLRSEMTAKGEEKKWLDWWQKAAFPIPRQTITAAIREGKPAPYKWERLINGRRFTVCPTTESVANFMATGK